jgi:hypothetical protein
LPEELCGGRWRTESPLSKKLPRGSAFWAMANGGG